LDASTGYAVGELGAILKTTNGGAAWVSQYTGTTIEFSSVHFPLDASTGYAVGEYATILKTTDGGTTWVSQNSGTGEFLYSVHFPLNASTGYAVGYGGTILKTTDGGGVGVEEARNAEFGMRNAELRITPNPFTSFATLPGHETERFTLYDISGRRGGMYRGDRIGEGLSPGVYFLRPETGDARPLRIVKVK